MASIMEAALSLFARQGYHATSVTDIAREAGIAKGLVYNYFASKEELLNTILQQGFSEMESFVRRLDLLPGPLEKLEFILTVTFSFSDEQLEFWKLFFALVMQNEIARASQQHMQDMYTRSLAKVTAILREIGIEDPEFEARKLMALQDGLSLHYMVLSNDRESVLQTIDKILREYKEMYMKQEKRS